MSVKSNIVKSLRGAAADMVWYLGPDMSVHGIIEKLELVYGTEVLFNILMQNIYTLQQNKGE